MRVRFLTKILFPIIALAFLAAPSSAADPKPIKIGLLYSLSGMAAVYTKGTVIGHQIAAEEINAVGGVLDGRKIEYVIRDDKLKPGIAVEEFRRMVTRDQVDFVMGVISSGVALAVSEVAKEMKVLFVDTIAQTAALTEEQGHAFVVRLNTNSVALGRTAALAAAKGPWKSYLPLCFRLSADQAGAEREVHRRIPEAGRLLAEVRRHHRLRVDLHHGGGDQEGGLHRQREAWQRAARLEVRDPAGRHHGA